MESITSNWLMFQSLVTPEWVGSLIPISSVNMAVNVLHDILVILFQKPDIAQLCSSNVTMEILLNYSLQLSLVMENRLWKRTTCHQVISTLRAILKKTNIPLSFIRATKLRPLEKDNNVRIIGKKYLLMSEVARELMKEWILIFKNDTHNVSPVSLKNIMKFVLGNLLPNLNLTVETFKNENIEIYAKKFEKEDLITKICNGKGSNMCKKLRWLQLFLTFILKSSIKLPFDLCKKLLRESKKNINVDDDDGSDHHRISTEDLEILYETSKKDELNELLFMTLLTTGMRLGGFVKIKTLHVAQLKNGKWQVGTEGKTIEKGNKLFTFKLHTRVQELLTIWLNKRRLICNSEYLFPGREGAHLSPEGFRTRFTKMCKEAGLVGKQFHPHALRHCYSHILLELGNSSETISKLINHSSVATTQRYYLKENAAEVSERANIPWLKQQITKRKNSVPSFLMSTTVPNETQNKHHKKMEAIQHVIQTLK